MMGFIYPQLGPICLHFLQLLSVWNAMSRMCVYVFVHFCVMLVCGVYVCVWERGWSGQSLLVFPLFTTPVTQTAAIQCKHQTLGHIGCWVTQAGGAPVNRMNFSSMLSIACNYQLSYGGALDIFVGKFKHSLKAVIVFF